MGIIKVENIRLFAHHGCLKEETAIGSDYRVDLIVKADLRKSAKTDALKDTVDYVFLNKVVREEMAKPSKLLETVAKRILNRIFKEDKKVKKASVSVSKINPPIGGDVEMVTIKMSQGRK
ncbi:dihydroneopterin aldolase [Winogradskyella aurantia]|jgi:dihydroneopterin aldolase|uniref:7,8-dihydroneopterin aldolase n=1 Tax=Winogradskyella aurantia TaxID=1915063 RepID=A0A265V038_9FLAO|nr:dihydroneopterin aldolase [Winogradskyella aurantia]OZV70852.1 dihydroneopterin aldolase [Winogradskyella aurantia]